MSERNAPRFDLIMCTLGRTAEPRRYVESVASQTWRDLRLIAVDQNDDHRLEPTLAEFPDVPSLHLRSPVGLSKGRNMGLRHVTADIVSFADDDCWYPPDLLERVAAFSTHTRAGRRARAECRCTRTGRPVDEPTYTQA